MKFAYMRYMLKASLIWLSVGVVVGIIMFLQKKMNIPVYLIPVHSHIILVGFLMQFIFGVAFWIFPRLPGGIFTSPRKGWTVFFLLNAGTLIRAVSEPFTFWISFSGAILQSAGILLGVFEIWKRVRAPF